MNRHIEDLMEDMFDFTVKRKYLFRNVCGLTFVFRRDITCMNDQLSSAEIQPVGIIYEENGEYYYAPLHDRDEMEAIVKEFVNEI